MRVRQEAQFALADRGVEAIKTLVSAARKDASQLARLHAIWGLGQIAECRNPNVECKAATALLPLLPLLDDSDAEVRAQAAKVLGDRRCVNAYEGLIKLLNDASPRTRFFAAMSLGKLGRREALPAIYAMLRENADQDPYLRHAGVMALTWIGDTDALPAAAKASSSAVRMAALLAMRRLHRDEIAVFLNDTDPAIVLEAARAINDEPINGAMHDLARLISRDTLLRVSGPTETSEDQGRGAPHSYPGWQEALLRRVLNANFRFGTMESAKALAAFAARSDAAYEFLRSALTAEVVAEYYKGLCKGGVVRYEMPNLRALNFVLKEALGGGGTLSLRVDHQGKTLAQGLLRMELDVPIDVFESVKLEHQREA